MSELKYWVWLASLKNVRSRSKKLLLEQLGGAREVYFARTGDYDRLDFLRDDEREALVNKDADYAKRVIDTCSRRDIAIITLRDAAYPLRLAEIYDPPLVLYVRGKLPPLDDICAVAVVGTRGASPYGLKMAQRMGYGIAKCGGAVVSGLTRGVDAAAARGALLAGGRCIGVLGTAIDTEYPTESIANDVAVFGALVSEYAPGTHTSPHLFRQRNRITSGLSAAALVVEAPAKSGALLFADEALNQGREVFAVPANADSVNAEGSNRLLMEGAHPAVDAWDILGEFAERFPNLSENGMYSRLPAELVEEGIRTAEKTGVPDSDENRTSRKQKAKKAPGKPVEKKKDIDKPEPEEYIDLVKQLEGLSTEQLAIVSAITGPHTHVDDIIERTGLPSALVLSELTMLRIKGCVIDEPGKRFSLNISQK